MPLVYCSNNTHQGVVGRTHGGHQHIPRFQCSKQGAGDGVGAVDKLLADQGRLRPEDLGVHGLQFLPACVVVAVAGGAGKISVGDPAILKRRKHPAGILPGNSVNAGKLLRQFALGLVPQGLYLW